ncbi:hypothetical protein QOT17_015019 [Balamuthia mandrillaris]
MAALRVRKEIPHVLRVHSMVPTSCTSSPGQVIIFLLLELKKREQREKEERQKNGAQSCHKPAVTSCVSSFLPGCCSQGGFEDGKGLSCGAKGRLRERAERQTLFLSFLAVEKPWARPKLAKAGFVF